MTRGMWTTRVSLSEVAEATGTTPAEARAHIDTLESSGWLRCIRPATTFSRGAWELTIPEGVTLPPLPAEGVR